MPPMCFRCWPRRWSSSLWKPSGCWLAQAGDGGAGGPPRGVHRRSVTCDKGSFLRALDKRRRISKQFCARPRWWTAAPTRTSPPPSGGCGPGRGGEGPARSPGADFRAHGSRAGLDIGRLRGRRACLGSVGAEDDHGPRRERPRCPPGPKRRPTRCGQAILRGDDLRGPAQLNGARERVHRLLCALGQLRARHAAR